MNIKPIGVEEWLNELETSAALDIAQSTIASLTTDEILALADDEQGGPGMGAKAFYDQLGAKKQNYGWIEGSPAFKQGVAALYQGVDGRGIDPRNVLQMNGATGANLAVLYTLVNPGDHVVAEYPTYQPLYEIPRTLGAKVDLWRIHEEDGWQPRIEELERLVNRDAKLICINNASNPTGTVLSRDQLEAIAQIARSVGAYVLSDEVYLPLEDTGSYCSIVDVYERGIATNSLSKTYSVPGIRIGWIVCDAELADRLRTCRDYSLICAGVFSDAMAVHVLRHRDQILARNRDIMLRNRAIVQEWIDGEPRASWVPPRGVSTSFIRLDLPMDDEAFCRKLLATRGVLLVPGSRFELPCGARLGYCAQEETLRRGLDELSCALRELD